MALKLTITSEQRGLLGGRASIVFGVGGGSIGRSHDNDWVLSDPNRYLSAHHARVVFRHGAYYLADTSANGAFVNDGTVPIGRRSYYPLRGGDRLRLGDYYIAVTIDPDPSEAPEASSIFPVTSESTEDMAATCGDIGAELDVGDLLRPDPSPSSRLGPVDAFGQPVLTDDTGLLAFDQSGQRPAPGRAALSATAARRELRASERAAAENATGMEAFCRGAGIDVKQLPNDAPARLLHLTGVLLREALVGLKGLALAQREMREQTQVDVGKEDPQHIGLTGLPVEDLLRRLLLGHDKHELDAVQWLRDTLGSARRHDLAMMRALHAALGEFITRLNPSGLTANGAHSTSPGSDGESSELTARFRSITEMPSGKLPHLFVEAFARAYADEYRQHNGMHLKS